MEIKEVKIPIATPCVNSLPEKPILILEKLPLESAVFDSVQALLLDRQRMGIYMGQLEAVIEACRE